MTLRNTIAIGVFAALAFGAAAGCLAYLLLAPSAPLPNPASNGWDRNAQGQGVSVPEALRSRLREHDRSRGEIDELSTDFRPALDLLLQRLRDEGWAARVALGPRSVDHQRQMVREGKSLILRGAHLCGLAADLSLYPVGMPPVDHAFWDAKDRIALELGLDVVDYPPDAEGFVDRPHVQLRRCSEAEWDALELSVVGDWSGDDAELRIERTEAGLRATWATGGDDPAAAGLLETWEPGVHRTAFDGSPMTIRSSVLGQSTPLPDYERLTVESDAQTWTLDRD